VSRRRRSSNRRKGYILTAKSPPPFCYHHYYHYYYYYYYCYYYYYYYRAFPNSISDVLLSLPIYILSFLCTFNILPVHSSLVEPTRARIQTVIHSSMT